MQNVIKIGIILPDFTPSQLTYYSVKYANALLTQTNQYDIVFFYEQLSPIYIRPFCSTMNISEIWSFDGLLISTTIDNTLLSVKAVNSAIKVFYIWDLEWIRGKQNFLHNLQAFRHPDIILVARSIDHAKVIENYCNKKVNAVIPNFQISSFLNLKVQ